MSSRKKIAKEILQMFDITDTSVIDEVVKQEARVAKILKVEIDQLPQKFKDLLARARELMGNKYDDYINQRSIWLAKNQDLLMIAYDLLNNLENLKKKSKI